ncbi:MAG: Alpha-amylase precursor [Myxococcales bacterium]|nr:Alpha-amylase precursor [Myxococcales bacterium]
MKPRLLLVAVAFAACRADAPAKVDVTTPTSTDAGREAGSDARSDAGPDVVSSLGAPPPGGVLVHLFEWRWTDVAKECEATLGPAGFAGVQISPPSEHAVLPGAPWWERYQTVGYSLARSRSGTGEDFADMVRRCAAVGVAIYADTVINHMTAQARGTGSNGTAFTKYSYPGLYAAADFHSPPCTIADADYQNAADRVRRCELVGLADLDTSSEHVRDAIAGYFSSLLALGVSGFRVDAAKHVAPADLDAILRRVRAPAGAPRPYYFFEVIDHGGEAIAAADYLTTGAGAADVDITEFKYSAVSDAFLGAGGASLAGLRTLGQTDSGLLPSDRAVVFVDNHDTERASSLYYDDGVTYDLATAFMLTWPYGTPSILSGYAFHRATGAGRDVGPPSDAGGATLPVYAAGANAPSCADAAAKSGWLCEHRRPYVARLVAFRKTTVAAPVTSWWDDGADAIAFARGDRGFVAINNGPSVLHRTFATGLAAGTYCDIFGGAPVADGCSGTRVDVDGHGAADVTLPPSTAVVLQRGAQVQ